MRLFLVLASCGALGALSGCHMFKANAGCHVAQEYMKARQMPPLKVPAGLDAPTKAPTITIPDVAADIPVRARTDACLEEPPKYKASSTSKPLPQT